jgi:drug/metabolite transporter (DMT)-like permease
MANLGQLAAIMTSLFFSFSSTFFTFATRKFGSMVVNRLRLVMAAILLIMIHRLLFGSSLPLNAGADRWFWLGLSGITGLVLGDVFLFQAYKQIGPHLTMLMMSLAPAIAALVAWLFLKETLKPVEIAGIMLTIGGIAWVVMDRNGGIKNGSNGVYSKLYLSGILFGLAAAAGQAIGLVLSKRGMVGNFSAISANLIRMVIAAITIWVITLFQGQAKPTLEQISRHGNSVWFIVAGMIAGPILGVSFSLYAVQNANVGIASTLMALPPIFLLPISYLVFKEHIGLPAISGTILALTGVAILFLN